MSNGILNDLKLLFNFSMYSRGRAAVLLTGLPQLNNTLRLNVHEPLWQRIVMNYDMDVLSKEEAKRYVRSETFVSNKSLCKSISYYLQD